MTTTINSSSHSLNSPLSKFGYLVQRWRTKHDVSQEQLAELLNINKETLQRWENGTTTPINPRMVERAIRDIERDIVYERMHQVPNPNTLVY